MIVAGADALAHCVIAATGFAASSLTKLRQQCFRGRLGVAMHRKLHRHLIAQFRHVDIDLRHHGAGRDQLALLGGPLRQAGAERQNKIALRDQLIGNRRREAAADADRPGISRKQSVAAHRRRQQRADAVGERDQILLGIGDHCAAAAEDERTLRAHQRVGEALDRARIGMQPPRRRRQFERRQVGSERCVLHVERHAQHHGLPVAQRAGDGAQHVFARRARRMQPLRHRTNRAHHFALLDVKIILHRSIGDIARQHQERRPAFRGFGDARERIGQPRAGMHADQRELAARLGISVAHGGGVAFVASGNQLDAGFDQAMGDFEIGGAEEAEAAPCAIAGKVLGDHARDRWIATHLRHLPCRPTRKPQVIQGHDGTAPKRTEGLG